MVPALGWSSPATRFNSVLLPQPDAPRRQTNSPGATVRVMSSRAWVLLPATPYTLDTLLICTVDIVRAL